MVKTPYKSQASSSRAFSGGTGFGGSPFGSSPFGRASSPFTKGPTSLISYLYEPPDLSGISDPAVVVIFKNLQKKDSTTKAKALEDLQLVLTSLEEAKEEVEDVVLEAWIKLYPRTSIDNARRVRQLCHQIQGQIAASCRKRMLKHMPSTIGAWLGGSFDSDKLVSRAAHGAFIRTFSEKEKQDGVWKAYQGAILEYSRDAILKETAQTLSDERTVSPDEAETKYARVLGSAMMTIANALECLAKAEVEKKEDLYTEIYQSERLWALASSSDSFVRRANYRLLSVGLDKVLSLINYQIVTTDLLQKGLIIDQSGSINDYLKVLVNVTVIEPQVWTTFYAGTAKKSADRRFRQFLEKGSQGGPLEVWRHISKLIQKIPMTILRPSENPDVSLVLSALRHGINRREEYRSGLDDAWNAYLHLVDRLRSSLSDKEERANFYEASLFSIMRQYFKPNEITSEWTITVQNPAQYCAKAAALVLDQSLNLLITELEKYSTTLVQDIKTSLPEQSKDHAASQESISEQSQRWYSFQAALLAHNKDASLLSTLTQTSTTELQAAMAALKNRNGKPYSAAAILHNALSYVPETTLRQQDLREDLFEFARTVAPSLMVSPSSSYLFKFIEDMSSVQDVQQIYQDGIETVIAAPTSTGRSKALQTLVSSPWPKSTKASDRLSKVVVDTLQQALDGKDGSWVLVASTVKNVSAPEALVDNVLLGLTEKLSLNDQTSEALRGTETILKQNTPAIRNFITSPNGTTLLSRLLFLSQLPDEDNLRYQAVNLKGAIDAMLSKEKFSHVTTDSMVKIIKSGLTDTSDAALDIEFLVWQAQKLVQEAVEGAIDELAYDLIPESEQWVEVLKPFMNQVLDPSLALTNKLGGAVAFVVYTAESTNARQYIPLDQEGRSASFRMAWFISKLLGSTGVMERLSHQRQVSTYCSLSLFAEIANDCIGMSSINLPWVLVDGQPEPQTVNFVYELEALLAKYRRSENSREFVLDGQRQLLLKASGRSVSSYYHARAYASAASQLAEVIELEISAEARVRFSQIRKTNDPIADAAFVVEPVDMRTKALLCSELVSDVTGWEYATDPKDGFAKLVFLNILLQLENVGFEQLVQSRAVFFIKLLISALRSGKLPFVAQSECLKGLCRALPFVKDVYDSFWAKMLKISTDILASERSSLPSIHGSLRLLATLRTLASDGDSNEDLQESWVDAEELLTSTLIGLLVRLSAISRDAHQPSKIVNLLLEWQLSYVLANNECDTLDLYPVIGCESAILQQAAFKILHWKIPSMQEKVTMDAALSSDYKANLPEELLSLILEIPKADNCLDLPAEQDVPTTLTQYLLGWRLIFDHWSKASFKVQTAYVASVKEGNYLKGLLDFAFHVLTRDRGAKKVVNASKYDFRGDYPGQEGSTEAQLNSMLCHLYFLSLKHLPLLVKSWWRNDCPRALEKQVEDWTEKYISPYVVEAELDTFKDWDPNPDSETCLEIKLNPRAHEVIASYPIDDQTMAIRISLPPAYPLYPISISTINRVAVDEKKWTSWLNTTDIMINFSSSSQGLGCIIDGLVVWRRNVAGQLKGQGECAICYSVVSVDKQLPNKRCGTCKNLFHGSCLFKWFKTSSSSSCPLCRNAFNYA